MQAYVPTFLVTVEAPDDLPAAELDEYLTISVAEKLADGMVDFDLELDAAEVAP